MSHSKPLDTEPVLAVFRRFSRFEDQQDPNEALGYEEGAAAKIRDCHGTRQPIPLLLPAAPFKNACPDKVLDTTSPDFAEELGLSRLNHLCEDLARVYPYGAELTMVSDGTVYNDLLCVPDTIFYDYGLKLRKIAADKGFTRIKFRRLADVLGIADGDTLPKEKYLALAATCRSEMEARYLPADLEVKQMIWEHKDTSLTYQGYIKLANDDLRWGPDLDPAIKNDAEKYAAETRRVAERMTERLLAYEKALEAAFPHHIRLSIHRSTGKAKISIPLIPQPNSFGPQPWHCCVVVTAQGQYLTGHSKDYRDSDEYEIINKDGKPYLVREKHDDFVWPEHIKIHHEYGGKIIVENTSTQDTRLSPELKIKLANLALRFNSLNASKMAQPMVSSPSVEAPNPFLMRPVKPAHSLSYDAIAPLDRLHIKDESKIDQLRDAINHFSEEFNEEKKSSHNDETVTAIMDILEDFSLQQQGNDEFLGRGVFSPCVRRHVSAGRKIPMVLPAFPAKSTNTRDKVLGPRPDLGEELALDRLNDLCTQIGNVYEPGATILIATDGACYNDLTGISDEDLFEYGLTLRRMAAEKNYHRIEFARIMNLLGLHKDAKITKERFIELLEPSRKELMARYGDPDFDVSDCIKNDPDYKMTYGGYAKFLMKDLECSEIKEQAPSTKKFKAIVHETAKAMIERGVAFAALIKASCPDYVRLSIHPSSGRTKVSMPLIPQPDSVSMTPWHCAVAVDTEGNFKTGHVEDLKDHYDLVEKDGKPYCFRERSELYSWDADVEFDHLYGGGVLVRNPEGSDQTKESLSDADREKLAELATLQGKIVMEGF
ncbi:Isocyanide synthase xanB [Paramyrothecium foliicola]|nr:Isocyanide synthase xanB [Paramyrothecium foliicola]